MKYIVAATEKKLQPGQIINQTGQYLYSHIDSAVKKKKSGNMFDVWFVVYYQKIGDQEVKEMGINLNLATYSDKIRMNIIEVTPREKTLGQRIYDVKAFNNIVLGSKKAFKDTQIIIQKAFTDYLFLF
jgi:hypothetical protein